MGTQLYTPSPKSIIHYTKVDFTNRLMLQKTINLVQYDRGIPIIAVSLYKNGSIYSLPTGMTVKIKWGKRDRTFVYKNALGCNTERNIIFFDVDEQMTYFDGKLDPIIELVDSSGSTPTMAGSSSIPVVIEKNPIQETDIESSNEYVDLVQAVSDAQQAAQYAEEIVASKQEKLVAGDNITIDENNVIGVSGVNERIDIVEDDLTQLDGKIDNIEDYVIVVETNVTELQAGKQDKLSAGNNITIDPNTNVISSRNDEPDGVTIALNEDNKLEVNLKNIMDGGYL